MAFLCNSYRSRSEMRMFSRLSFFNVFRAYSDRTFFLSERFVAGFHSPFSKLSRISFSSFDSFIFMYFSKILLGCLPAWNNCFQEQLVFNLRLTSQLLHFKHLQDLVAVMVDNLYSDLAGPGFIERAADRAVEALRICPVVGS